MSEEKEKEKTGFWGLFRGGTLSRKLTKSGRDRPGRVNGGSNGSPSRRDRRRTSSPPAEVTSSRRRPRRPKSETVKGKGLDTANGHSRSYEQHVPLTEWPPLGINSDEELTLGQAMELISRGVPVHRGHKRPIPHASDHYYALFAKTAGPGHRRDDGDEEGEATDAADSHEAMTQLMTLKLGGASGKGHRPEHPWETLEQPSYAFWFGDRPGTVTLNRWAAMGSVVPPSIALRDSGVAPREVDLAQIFQRLKDLERGLEDDDEELMYRNLYRKLLKDPDKFLNPHKTLDKQITDLIMVLSRPDWIDFTNPRNQIVTRFIFDTGHTNHQQYVKFFHQLLLTLELDLRINSKQHGDWAKEKLLQALPPTIQWGLALSRRWRDFVRVEAFGKTADQVRLRLKLRRRQVKMLKRFAQIMKWPNLAATVAALKQRDADSSLDAISSHAMAFFSGLVMPGPTFPFVMMNSLIDVDPDPATDDLALLTHLHPHCGFQHRNSYTYWTSASVVGKVLAPTCREVGGWVGPARPTVDLSRSQIARIRSRRPRQSAMSAEDVKSMAERSDPLGPPTQVFPVKEYALVADDDLAAAGDRHRHHRRRHEDPVDTVRIEMLSLRPAPDRASEPGPAWCDASVQFAIDGVSWPLRLAYDVEFVCAWPCRAGPHPLFFDYTYATVRADEVVDVREWGVPGALASNNGSSGGSGSSADRLSPPPAARRGSSRPPPVVSKGGDDEKVLVVEAFGVPDNEVLARAWCAHWGLSAVVADVGRTW
ncbi:uncharacterized protein E0L32_008030 [Thyridium curvatum]|uniref:Uncharacterized protein n=1 Tax=Thyridium curvatum TaxID=1093900 RepID=A0A507ATC0_9PEZI|nr:uncharacterized protein E0L32_008030 [Thyridium curvatum]TPX10993.1 hypothetical protein E0L32_008030 [Thyridium curvatum]